MKGRNEDLETYGKWMKVRKKKGDSVEAAMTRVIMPEGIQEQRTVGDSARAAGEGMLSKKQRTLGP